MDSKVKHTKKKRVLNSEVPLSVEFKERLLNPYLSTLKSDRSRTEYRLKILSICGYFYRRRGERYSFEQLTEEDAKEYFLQYLSGECRNGHISFDTFRLHLSVCKNFALFLQKQIPHLFQEGIWESCSSYQSPFEKIIRPAASQLVRTNNVISEVDIDAVLSNAKDFDIQLFIILLFSFRILLPQRAILSLKREDFSFLNDTGRHIGIFAYIQKNEISYKRIPADILSPIEQFVLSRDEGHIFRNRYGNPMNAVNLSALLDKFETETGCRIKLGQLRTRGIIDLVSHNPDALDEIEDYTGLSKRMIQGYGDALDRIAGDCIADRSGYKILSIGERRGSDE